MKQVYTIPAVGGGGGAFVGGCVKLGGNCGGGCVGGAENE